MSERRPRAGSSGWKKSGNWADAANSPEIRRPSGLASPNQSLYGGAAFGEFTVSRTSSPVPSRWAVILLTAATLALAGCGRKGGLDLPPTAAAPPPGAAQAEGATATPGSVFDPSFGANKDPVAPPGKKRSFILDPLLD
jgi:predicted small lipoprotein YifL